MENTKRAFVDVEPLYDRLEALQKEYGIPKTHSQIFSENLEKIRKQKGFTRKKLAEAIGITEIAYGAYERGIRQPPLDKIFILADFLKVAVVDLIGEGEKTSEHKFFEYRLRRATKLANLAGYSLNPLNNGIVELELPGKWSEGKFKDGDAFFSKWARVIPIKSSDDFVQLMEMAQEKAVKENITFSTALNAILSEADKTNEEKV